VPNLALEALDALTGAPISRPWRSSPDQ